jgi:PhnB protein
MTTAKWTLAPYLRVDDAAKAIDFYTRALGAVEIFRYPMPDGTIGHAELDFHGNKLCLADSDFSEGARSAAGRLDAPIMLYAIVPAVDEVFARAIEAGAVVSRPLADQDYGERNGGFVDPFGHHWFVGTPHPTTS